MNAVTVFMSHQWRLQDNLPLHRRVRAAPLLQVVITSLRKKLLTQLPSLIYSPLNLYFNSSRRIVKEVRKTVTIAAVRVTLAVADLATNYPLVVLLGGGGGGICIKYKK